MNIDLLGKQMFLEMSLSERISEQWNLFWPAALKVLGTILIAFIIFLIGKKLIRWAVRLIGKAFERMQMEPGVAGFISSVLKAVLYFLLFMIIANVVGIATASVVALVGSVGLTIGLALQGSLSNFAGGVLILLLKPFRVGDYILAQGLEGVVTKVDLFYTSLLTVDNRTVVLPNGVLSNGSIVNVTHEPERRLDLLIPIGYGDDIRTAKELLRKIADRHSDKILQNRDITTIVGDFGDDAIEIAFRVWVKKEDYWDVRAALLEDVKYMFDEQGITIPFHQLDVFMKKD